MYRVMDIAKLSRQAPKPKSDAICPTPLFRNGQGSLTHTCACYGTYFFFHKTRLESRNI